MYDVVIQVLAIVGAALSQYFIHVKCMVDRKVKKYKPLCDISKNISCTKAAKSNFSAIFKVPNAHLGLIYYTLVFVCALFSWDHLILALSIPAAFLSICLIAAQFKIRTFCVVCTATYFINFAILYLSYVSWTAG